MNDYRLKNHPFFLLNGLEKIKKYFDEYPGPAFIYSKDVISFQYERLSKSLPYIFKIFYAQKSNPNPEILKYINSLGAGCDTASEGEIKSALSAGFLPDSIMLTGPAKTESELKLAIEKNLLTINAESLQELELIEKLSAEFGKKQDVLIRINPRFEAGETNRIIGGMGISKFGIDIDFIPQIFERIMKFKYISVKGIHIFNSSQILDAERILLNIKDVIDTAKKLSSEYKINFELIDAGGGLGIPYLPDEKFLDIEKLGIKLDTLISSGGYKEFLSGMTVILEPGRYLTGLAGIYLTKVLYTKESCGKKIALIDGGIHHLIRPVLIGQKHTILNLTGILEDRKNTAEYMVAGPLCTSLDRFDESAVLTEIKQGDILAVLNAGAYGYTESMPMFLSHKRAKEIFIN